MTDLFDLLRRIEADRFYGTLELKFEAGKVVLLRRIETIKPVYCRINRGKLQNGSTESD